MRVSSFCRPRARSVPSSVIAPERCSAQSPPDGMPCGSRYVARASRSERPRIVTSRTGAACVPETLKSTRVRVATHVGAIGPRPRRGRRVRVEVEPARAHVEEVLARVVALLEHVLDPPLAARPSCPRRPACPSPGRRERRVLRDEAGRLPLLREPAPAAAPRLHDGVLRVRVVGRARHHHPIGAHVRLRAAVAVFVFLSQHWPRGGAFAHQYPNGGSRSSQ